MQDASEDIRKSAVGQAQEPVWNVPMSLTSMVGREEETKHICALLSRPEIRLLTLLGPGGIGKTRLSIEVATHMRSSFADGICFVTLAPIREHSMVLLTMAQALHIPEVETQPLLQLVTVFLREKRMLLILDNFEQVRVAKHILVSMLEACPHVKILVTSRTSLHIQSEQEFYLQPLALPSLSQFPEYTMLTGYAAVALFLQRVQEQIPDFQITPFNARAIAEICVQVDGLPLAVELAAARIKLLPPQALLARLSRRLQLLTNGSDTLPPRQQTLCNTLKWSYDLLDQREQQLFRRISVFMGGCSLDAIENLYVALDDDAHWVLDGLASLVNNSLLQQTEREGAEPRLVMLETIREYGLACLAESEEAEKIQHLHAMYYLALVERVEPELEGSRQAEWMKKLEREHSNLRAALQWAGALVKGTERQERREIALRLAVALRRFWLVRGHIREGQNILEHMLAMGDGATPGIYAKALLTLGMLVSIQGDHDRAQELFSRSLEIFRAQRDARNVATALYQLGRLAWMRGDLQLASSLAEEALRSSRESGHEGSIAWSLFRLARLTIEQGEYARGYILLEENLMLHKKNGNRRAMAASLYHLAWVHLSTQSNPAIIHALNVDARSIFNEISDKEGIAYCLYLSGRLALVEGDITTARSQVQESERMFREMLHKEGTALSLSVLGRITTIQADYKVAHDFHRESLEFARELDYKGLLAYCIEGLAEMAAVQVTQQIDEEKKKDKLKSPPTIDAEAFARICWVARLWGAAKALRDTYGLPLAPVDRVGYERIREVVHRLLGEEIFSAEWAEGQTLPLAQVLNEHYVKRTVTPVLSVAQVNPAKSSKSSLPDGLTVREAEVLKLVAQGLTSAQIAEQLTLSLLTVNSHVRSIYNKLGITSRSGATRYAMNHNLI